LAQCGLCLVEIALPDLSGWADAHSLLGFALSLVSSSKQSIGNHCYYLQLALLARHTHRKVAKTASKASVFSTKKFYTFEKIALLGLLLAEAKSFSAIYAENSSN